MLSNLAPVNVVKVMWNERIQVRVRTQADRCKKAVKHAVLAEMFSVLSNRVAWRHEGDNAQLKVAEAAEETVLELVGHGEGIP